jgi:calcineurin-like phosphoesterase family protein
VRRFLGALGVAFAVAGCAAPQPGATPQPAATTTPAPTASALLVAAGDIACRARQPAEQHECAQQTTAELVLGLKPTTVLALGDTQYEDGSPEEYAAYDASWGRFKNITLPVVGNHEYQTPDAKGYYAYFGDQAGDPTQGWYATTAGAWRVIVLNSECVEIGGCGPDSPQGRWLSAQLHGAPRCTAVAYHRPRFSSGAEHGDDPSLAPLWAQLHDGGVDVVLNGHDHDYERFAPRDADGQVGSGPVEFVVGTGGADLRGFSRTDRGSEVRWADSVGVLALTLRPDGYDWRFVDPDGTPPVDSGTGTCREQ